MYKKKFKLDANLDENAKNVEYSPMITPKNIVKLS